MYLKKHATKYNYPYKTFMRKIFLKNTILRPIGKNKLLFTEALHRGRIINLGQYEDLVKAEQDLKACYIVQHGVLEVYTHFETNEFIVDRLEQGSVIFAQGLHGFGEDIIKVNIRAMLPTVVYELSITLF